MTSWEAALVSATACAAGALIVPLLVARVPAAVRQHEPYAVPVAAAAGAVIGGTLGASWSLLFLLPLVPVGVALGLIDARTHLLPTVIIWPAFGGVVALAAVSALLEGDPEALGRAALGSAVVFLAFHALWWIHPAGMGYGDVRLSAVLGFALGYLGWAELLVGVYGGFLVFAVSGFVIALLRRDRQALKASYPFGPFLLVGALAGIAFGPAVWSYLVSG